MLWDTEYLDYVIQNVNIPFVAIGGIKEQHLQNMLERGVQSCALVTDIVNAKSISQKIKDLNMIKEEIHV